MKKVLYITTVSRTVNAFLVPHIQMLLDEGYHVDIATCIDKPIDETLLNRGVKVFEINFSRNPLNINNLRAIRKILKLQRHQKYDLIHVHTPVAAFIARLSLRNENVKIVYTTHGFHFYKGAPLRNWLIYYPLEVIASRWTDSIITINEEDFKNANKLVKNKDVEVSLIHGVGIVPEEYFLKDFNIIQYRYKLGFSEKDFIILVLAELNKNKNHIQLFKALTLLDDYPNIKVICAGQGDNEDSLKIYVKNHGLEKKVSFLGFRSDVKELLSISDCVGLFSRREGLGKCLLEGLCAQKPLIATDTRGPREIIINEVNGYLIPLDNELELANAIKKVYDKALNSTMDTIDTQSQLQKFSLDSVLIKLHKIYSDLLER